MQKEIVEKLREICPGFVEENVPMCDYTTFRIGGPADVMVRPQSDAEIAALLRFFSEKNVPYLVVGNGSNLLVSDKGIRAVVVLVRDRMNELELTDETTIIVGAGVRLIRLVEFAAEHALAGLAFAYGIPGCVGGALTMNAGAYGGQMADVVESVYVAEPDGTLHWVPGEELQYGYRTSTIAGGRIAIRARLKMQKGDEAAIRAEMQEHQEARKAKQPLEFPSAGSVFKRPVGYFAGTLIQECDLKGVQIGGAQVSEKHAGFIINRGGATCRDVLDLIAHIQKTVFEKRGVMLETELRPVGEIE